MQMEMSDGILPCYFNSVERVHLAQERIIILKVLAYSTDKITISRCVACLYNRPLSSLLILWVRLAEVDCTNIPLRKLAPKGEFLSPSGNYD